MVKFLARRSLRACSTVRGGASLALTINAPPACVSAPEEAGRGRGYTFGTVPRTTSRAHRGRRAGAVRASKLLVTGSGEAISSLLELLEFENDRVALEALERFAGHPDAEVQESVQRVAGGANDAIETGAALEGVAHGARW